MPESVRQQLAAGERIITWCQLNREATVVTDRRLLYISDIRRDEAQHFDFRHVSETKQGVDHPSRLLGIPLPFVGFGLAPQFFSYAASGYLLVGIPLLVLSVWLIFRSRAFIRLTVVGREHPVFFYVPKEVCREMARAIVAQRDQAATVSASAAQSIRQLAVSKHEPIQRLADLYASGYITREQFERERQKFLDLA